MLSTGYEHSKCPGCGVNSYGVCEDCREQDTQAEKTTFPVLFTITCAVLYVLLITA